MMSKNEKKMNFKTQRLNCFLCLDKFAKIVSNF